MMIFFNLDPVTVTPTSSLHHYTRITIVIPSVERGFLYHPIVEDYFSGFIMHCKGWKSVYYDPSRPAFVGSATISFNDTMIQNLRWSSGLLEVSNPWFIVFAISYISSLSQHLSEVLLCGDSLRTWWNEQRNWMIKSVASYSLSCLNVFMKRIGKREANFMLTSKIIDEEQVQKYKKGIFDFRGSKLFLVILATLGILNIVSLFGGLAGVISKASYDDMFV
ncbi:hypothetical protein NE237_014555 [Protea cynaroides]|uniref:Uncharacterized protein n=1 Tax=Protea cynaroides TaxID=273540 RepID=A0A9Q0KCG2_9MAGN|nr:hypothetical protein NE237_014555 [Protea cynaroides]